MSKLLTISEVLAMAQKQRASDIHIICGIPITLRIDGHLDHLDDNVMTAADCEAYARELSEHYDEIRRIGEQDLAIGFPDGTRCRVNLFRQQGSVSCAIRILNNHIPTFDELGLPPQVQKLTDFSQGIILVTGETGAGSPPPWPACWTSSTTPSPSTSSPWKTPSSTSTPPTSASSTSARSVTTPVPIRTV